MISVTYANSADDGQNVQKVHINPKYTLSEMVRNYYLSAFPRTNFGHD